MKRYLMNKVDMEHRLFEMNDNVTHESLFRNEMCWLSPGSTWLVTDIDTGESQIFTKPTAGESSLTYGWK